MPTTSSCASRSHSSPNSFTSCTSPGTAAEGAGDMQAGDRDTQQLQALWMGWEAGAVTCKRTNAADTEAQQQVASKQSPAVVSGSPTLPMARAPQSAVATSVLRDSANSRSLQRMGEVHIRAVVIQAARLPEAWIVMSDARAALVTARCRRQTARSTRAYEAKLSAMPHLNRDCR